MNKYLYDHLGNKYERKNLYLLELANLHEKKSEGNTKEIKAEIQLLKRSRKTHPYIISLRQFENEEKIHRNSFSKSPKDYEGTKFIRKLKFQLEHAERDLEFYKKYVDLSYDAQLSYETARVRAAELPLIIEAVEKIETVHDQTLESKNTWAKEEVDALRDEYRQYRDKLKEKKKEDIIKVNEKYREGTISQKARKASIAELDRAFKENLSIKKLEFPREKFKATLSHTRFDLRNTKKKSVNLMNDLIVDAKTKIPMETMTDTALVPFLTALFPGLGQLIYGQKKKASIMSLISLFIYIIAIPYALGYGNYQGNGLRGLITLKGDLRYVSSMIFLIEGILAIFLLVIAIFMIIVNFKDLRKIEAKKKKGIRPNNWHETKSKIFVDGYPYVVTLPAFITIIFVVLVPIATTILLSFTNRNDLPNKTRFIWSGLSNYADLFAGKVGTAAGPFWNIFGWTIVWTLASTTLAILLGFALALLLNNDRIKLKKLFRSVYLLPWAVPAFVSILFFRIMFGQGDAGVLRAFLGIETVIHNANLTRLVLILLQGWLGSAYVFILSTGVLQAVPDDLYEAAYMDGASSWKKLTRITLPIVLFQTMPLLIAQYTFNFNNFSIIYLFNGGGPNLIEKYGIYAGSSDILLSYIYKLTMDRYYFAMGAAVTLVISLIVIFITFLGFRNTKAFREERL
ncbi:MAG TPA: sugar ABC transporter permease [Clostridia bacterium]|nr:sugar ABC transporter permease [Clostridia bacterium]